MALDGQYRRQEYSNILAFGTMCMRKAEQKFWIKTKQNKKKKTIAIGST